MEVNRFVYLGTVFTTKPDVIEGIQNRLMVGNRYVYSLNRLLKSNLTSRRFKIKLYTAIVRPTVTFASEVWTLGKRKPNMLEVWERKMLRKKTNKELSKLYQRSSIMSVV